MTQKIEWLYPSNGNPPDIPKKYKEKDKISTIGVVLFQSKTPLFNDILDNIELFYKDFYVISDSETALNVIKNNLLFDINHFEEIRQSLSDYYLKTYNIKLNGVPQWDDKLENWIRDVYVGDVKITITNCENPNIYLYTDIEVKKYFNVFLEYKLKPKYNRDDFYQQLKIQFDSDKSFNELYNYFYGYIFNAYALAAIIKSEETDNMKRLFKQFNEVLTKDIFKQKIIEAVNYKPKLEYLKSKFNHPNFDEIYIGDKTIDEWYIKHAVEFVYRDMLNSAQFIGRRNYINYVNRSKPIDMIIEPSDEDEKIQPVQIKEIATDSFNLKYNKKYYGLHHVAFPGTYQMDLFFSAKNKNCYLLAIEVNTRYLYVARTNIALVTYENGREIKEMQQKTDLAIYLAMEKLFEQGWKPSIIKSDSEPAFDSKFIKEKVYKKRFITHQTVYRTTKEDGKTLPNHTSLAIADRVIKTIKKTFKNRGYINGQLPYKEVYKFVEHYNNRKHRTLSSILKRPTTPAEVHNDFKLEVAIIKNRIEENKKIKQRDGWLIPKNTTVKVYKDIDMSKNNRTTRIDKYIVNRNIGNIYEIINKRTGEPEFISRIKISRD